MVNNGLTDLKFNRSFHYQAQEFETHEFGFFIQALQNGEFFSQIMKWRNYIKVYKLQRTKVSVYLVHLEQGFLRYVLRTRVGPDDSGAFIIKRMMWSIKEMLY